jgi:hypothetical protein
MAYKISFQNSGGELDSKTVAVEADLKQALLDMIEDVAHLSEGDQFIITEIE